MSNCGCNTFQASQGNIMIGSGSAAGGRLHVVQPSGGSGPALRLECPTGYYALELYRGGTVLAQIRKDQNESMVFKSPTAGGTAAGFVFKDGHVSLGDTDVASENYQLEVLGDTQVTGKLVTGGAVGVGTDSPSAGRLLDVNGNVEIRDDLYVEDNIHLMNSDSSLYGENGRRLVDYQGCFYAP